MGCELWVVRNALCVTNDTNAGHKTQNAKPANLKLLAIVLLLAGLLFASQQTGFNQGQQESKLDQVMDRVEHEGQQWWITGQSAGGTVSGMFDWIWKSDADSCRDPWAGPNPDAAFGVSQLQNSALAAMVVAFALTLLYMFGQLLQSPKLLATARDEGFQLGIMVIEVAAIFFAIQVADMFYRIQLTDPVAFQRSDPDAFQLYTSNPTIIDAAMAYSRLMVFKITKDITALAVFNTIVHGLYSSTLWFGLSWRAMFSFNLGPALKPIVDIIGSVMQYLGIALGEWILHIITLCLIKKWTWGLFVPAGMILYMIPHTRSAGTALVAIMFSLSLVYPLMFVANYEIWRITSGTLIDDELLVHSFYHDSGLSGVGLFAVAMVFMMAGVVMPLFATAAVNIVFELVKNAIYYVVIVSLLLPFLNIFVTLTAAREFAKVFGVNINFMSFMRVI